MWITKEGLIIKSTQAKQAHLAGSGRETDGALLIFWRNRRTERLCSPTRYRRNESPTRADGTTRMGKTEREREM